MTMNLHGFFSELKRRVDPAFQKLCEEKQP
jgi:hypothetical protein